MAAGGAGAGGGGVEAAAAQDARTAEAAAAGVIPSADEAPPKDRRGDRGGVGLGASASASATAAASARAAASRAPEASRTSSASVEAEAETESDACWNASDDGDLRIKARGLNRVGAAAAAFATCSRLPAPPTRLPAASSAAAASDRRLPSTPLMLASSAAAAPSSPHFRGCAAAPGFSSSASSSPAASRQLVATTGLLGSSVASSGASAGGSGRHEGARQMGAAGAAASGEPGATSRCIAARGGGVAGRRAAASANDAVACDIHPFVVFDRGSAADSANDWGKSAAAGGDWVPQDAVSVAVGDGPDAAVPSDNPADPGTAAAACTASGGDADPAAEADAGSDRCTSGGDAISFDNALSVDAAWLGCRAATGGDGVGFTLAVAVGLPWGVGATCPIPIDGEALDTSDAAGDDGGLRRETERKMARATFSPAPGGAAATAPAVAAWLRCWGENAATPPAAGVDDPGLVGHGVRSRVLGNASCLHRAEAAAASPRREPEVSGGRALP